MDDHTVVGRTLEILAAAGSRARIGLAELTAMTGIPKPTVHRIAEDFVRRGVFRRTELGYEVSPQVHRWARPYPEASRLEAIASALELLRERFGGIAWYVHHSGDLGVQPTLAIARGPHRVLAATAWPDLSTFASLTTTAAGHAVLASRPNLLARIVRSRNAEDDPARARQVIDSVRRGVDHGAFLDDERAAEGWRCVAVHVSQTPGSLPGILGLTVPMGRAHTRDLISVTRAATDTLISSR